jgi:DNA-binding response OmpR family regulator
MNYATYVKSPFRSSQNLSVPRVIVVDDEPKICQSLTRALGLMGYDVEPAESGQQALEMLESKAYDVMVLDLVMPDMDGLEVMRLSLEKCPDLLVIVLTGHASLESAIAAVRYGAVDYLVKAVSLQDVANAVADALQKRSKQVQERVLVRTLTEVVDALPQVSMLHTSPPLQPEPTSPHILHVPPLRLNLIERTVASDDNPLQVCKLTNAEVDLLFLLMTNADHTVQVKDLAEATQGFNPGDRTARSVVSHHIHRLRRKLPAHSHLIRTIRGRGYMFVSNKT